MYLKKLNEQAEKEQATAFTERLAEQRRNSRGLTLPTTETQAKQAADTARNTQTSAMAGLVSAARMAGAPQYTRQAGEAADAGMRGAMTTYLQAMGDAEAAERNYSQIYYGNRKAETEAKTAAARTNPEFLEKSKGDADTAEQAYGTWMGLNKNYNIYNTIYNRKTAFDEQKLNELGRATVGQNLEKQKRDPYYGVKDPLLYITDQEAETYFYIWNTEGPKQATAYIDTITPELNARREKDRQAANVAYATENPVAASANSVLQNQFSILGAADLAGQNVRRYLGDEKPVDYNSPMLQFGKNTQEIRGTVAENLAEKHPAEVAGVNVASFLYQTGMSMADSGVQLVLNRIGIPEPITLTMMSGGAAQQAVLDAKERGISDGQALLTGIAAGTAEYIFEKISLDHFVDSFLENTGRSIGMNATRSWGSKWAKKIASALIDMGVQGVTEGSEEAFTTIANTITDNLINGDFSQFRQDIAEYENSINPATGKNFTRKEATTAAAQKWFRELISDALGGFISGFGMGAGGAVYRGISPSAQYRAARTEYETLQAKAQEALDKAGHPRPDIEAERAELEKLRMPTAEESGAEPARQGDSLPGRAVEKLRGGREAYRAKRERVDPEVLAKIVSSVDGIMEEAWADYDANSRAMRDFSAAVRDIAPHFDHMTRRDLEKYINALRPLVDSIGTDQAKEYLRRINDAATALQENDARQEAGAAAEEETLRGEAQERQQEAPRAESPGGLKLPVNEAMEGRQAETGEEAAPEAPEAEERSGLRLPTAETKAETETRETETETEEPKAEAPKTGKKQTVLARQRQRQMADTTATTAREAGFTNGDAEAPVYVRSEETWDADEKQVAQALRERGIEPVFVTGLLKDTDGNRVTFLREGDRLLLQADNRRSSLGQIAEQALGESLDIDESGMTDAVADVIQKRLEKAEKTAEKNGTKKYGERGEAARQSAIDAGASEADANTAARLADLLGKDIRFFRDEAQSGSVINGKTQDGVIYINAAVSKRTVVWVVAHELTHNTEHAKAYKGLLKLAKQYYGKQWDAKINARVEMSRRIAADRGDWSIALKPEDAMRELVADYVADKLLTDEEVIRQAVEYDAPTMRRVLAYLKSLLAKLKKEPSLEWGIDRISTALKQSAQAAVDKTRKNSAEERVGINLDDKTESANAVQFSYETWEASDYVQNRQEAAEDLAQRLNVSKKKALKFIDDVNGIARMILEDRERLDYEASPGRSSFIGNTEYGGSVDFSTICKKRRLYTGTIEAIQKAMPNEALTANEMLRIRSMMKERGYEVSCGLCYVEGSRVKIGEYTLQFLEELKGTGLYVPTMAEMNTSDGQEKLRAEHPEVYDEYVKFMNKLAQRKPKLFQMATEYQGEILKKFKNDGTVEEKNRNGGLRLQSFSDFEIIHLIDTMQVITDMSRVGLAGQAYTKVPDFAWAFGDTGLKINLSLIAKGVDADGNIILDEVEGMKRADAEKLRNAYSKNVGTILVTFTDEQLKAAMADPFIDFIIPFHRSQWSKAQYEAIGLPENAKDYTDQQNESYIRKVYNSAGKTQRPANYMPNNYWDFKKSGKANAEAYLKMCAENNRRPKFYKLLVDNGDGSYSLQPDGSTDGYWKLLSDYKMYDNSGKGSPQLPVKPKFNMTEAARMLNEYTGGHQSFPVARDVVDDFLKGKGTLRLPTAEGTEKQTSGLKLPTVDGKTEAGTLKAEATPEQAKKDIKYSAEEEKTEKPAPRIYKNGLSSDDLDTVHSLPQKSINDLTSEETQSLAAFAEMYWKDIRELSPFFRAWFGDWRANDHLTKVRVADKKGTTRIVHHNDDTGWDINISGMVYNETKSQQSSKSKAAVPYLDYLDDIVEKAVLLDSWALGAKQKSENSILMHSFYAVADIGNGPELLKLYVEEMNDPNQEKTAKRTYKLLNMEKSFPASGRVQGQARSSVTNTGNNIRTIADLFAAVKAHDKDFNPRPSSLVVDENGRPKIVYHQTAADIEEFKTDNPVAAKYDSETPNGTFFKENDHDIGLDGKKQMPMYLDMKKPLHFKNREEANRWYSEHVEGYKALQDEMKAAVGEYDQRLQKIEDQMFAKETDDAKYDELDKEWDEEHKKMGEVEDQYRGQLRELLNDYFIRKNSGYDGIILDYDGHRYVNGKRENVKTYIVFNNTQAKSATENIGTYDRGDSRIRYSAEEDEEGYAPTFYSRLEREIENYKGGKLGAASVESYLRGHGVKEEEIKWSGIRQFLEGKKSVTKDELLEFVRANRLEIEEETIEDDAVAGWDDSEHAVQYKSREDVLAALDDYVEYYNEEERGEGEDPITRDDLRVYEYPDVIAVYHDHERIIHATPKKNTNWSEYKTEGGENYREILFRMPGSKYTNPAMSTHWKGKTGVLAHARVQDFRTEPDPETGATEKVLFVEEIQSDWHNAGQKHGYSKDTNTRRDRMNELYASVGEREEDFNRLVDKYTGTEINGMRLDQRDVENGLLGYGVAGNYHDGLMEKLSPKERDFVTKYKTDFDEAMQLRSDKDLDNMVPPAPYAKNYHEFVLKNLLRQAAENGYGYVAWTTGEMQEERWSKEYAEGYRIEYDQDIPKFLNKYGKQWGAKVTEITLDENGETVPAIQVTDAMKQSVLHEGQPQYSAEDEDEETGSRKLLGTTALDRIGVKVSGSVGKYGMAESLLAKDKAAKSLARETKKAEKRLAASAAEKEFANGIAAGVYSEEDIPATMNRDKVLELVDYYWAQQSANLDTLHQLRANINKGLQDEAQSLLEDADITPQSMLKLNERTPERSFRAMFGDRAEAITKWLLDPVRENEAEKIRWYNRQMDAVRKFTDSKGKSRRLKKEERALTMRYMEGRAAADMVAGMETASAIRNAASNIKNGEAAGDAAKEFGLSYNERDLAEKLAGWMQTLEDLKKADTRIVEEAAKKYSEIFDQYYAAINDFLVAHGYEPIGYIKGYAPHMQPEENQTLLNRAFKALGVNTEVTELPASIAGQTAFFKPNKRWNPYFLQRTGKTADYDIERAYQSYVDYMADVLYHTDDVMRIRQMANWIRKTYAPEEIRQQLEQARELNGASTEEKQQILRDAGKISTGTVLSPTDTQKAMQDYVDELYENIGKTTQHSNLVMWLENYANILAGKQSFADRGWEYSTGRKSLNWANRLSNAFQKANVAGNLSSVLNQMAQLPMIYAELGERDLTKALLDVVSGKTRAWAADSDFLTAKAGQEMLLTDNADKFISALFAPAGFTDALVSTVAVRGAYNKYIRQGMSHAEAMRKADAFGQAVMGSRARGSKPLAYESKGFFSKLVHQFQIEAVNSWDHVATDIPYEIRKIARTQGKPKAAEALAALILRALIGAFVLNRLTDELYGGTPAPFDILGLTATFLASGKGLSTNDYIRTIMDNVTERNGMGRVFNTEPMTKEDFDLETAAEELIYNVMNDVPLVRNAAGVLGLGDQTVPLPGFGRGELEGIKDSVKGMLKDGVDSKDVEKLLRATFQTTTQFVPGGRQIRKTAEGAEAAIRGGSYKNGKLQYPVEGAADITKALLFGKSATSAAQDYWAAGGKALTEKQTELHSTLAASGVDRKTAYDAIQRYRELENDKSLTSLERGKAERALISGLGISDADKLEAYRSLTGADTRADKFRSIMSRGVTFAEMMRIYDQYADIDSDDDKKATDKAKEFALWVDKQKYTEKQKTEIKDQLKYYSHVPAEAERYEDLTGRGLKPDAASAVDRAISNLKPLAGKSGVTDTQKWNAGLKALGKSASTKDKLAVVGSIVGTNQFTDSGEPSRWNKINRVVDSGETVEDTMKMIENGTLDTYIGWMDSDAKKADVKSDTYLTWKDKAKSTKSTYDSNGKAVKGQERKDKLVAYINGLNLTSAQKDALYLEEYKESGLKDTPWHKGGGSSGGKNSPASFSRTLKLPTVDGEPAQTRSRLRLPTA